MTRFFALVLFLLAACVGPDVHLRMVRPLESPHAELLPPAHVYVDDAFDAADREAIAAAVDVWDYTLQGARRLVVRPSHLATSDLTDPQGILVMRVDSSCKFIPQNKPGVLAFADKVGGSRVWIVRDRIGPEDVAPIALHELGHVLGAYDREGPGLMHGTFYRAEYTCVDRQTAAEVAGWMGLGPDSLAHCEQIRGIPDSELPGWD